MGNKDGFNNVQTKQLHDISTRFIMETAFSLHENVTQFDEDWPVIVCCGL